MGKRALRSAVFILYAGMLLAAFVGCSKFSGPPNDFLSQKFMITNGHRPPTIEEWKELTKVVPSLESCTAEKFFSVIKGDKHWEKADNGWILRTEITDEVTKKKNKAAFVFDKTTDGIVLSRAVIDEQDYPGGQLCNLIVGIMEGATQK